MNDDKRRGMLKATVLAGMALATYAGGCGNGDRYYTPISAGGDCLPPECTQPEAQPVPKKLERPVLCTVDPKLLDDPSALEAATLSVSPGGTHLYVTRGDRTLRLNVEASCNLILDSTFSEDGVLEGPVRQVFETERGILVNRGGLLGELDNGSTCDLGDSLVAVADDGNVGAAVDAPGADSKVVRRFAPAGCTVDPSSASDATLRAALHVAAGPGPAGSLLFAASPPGQATTIESYDPLSRKVAKAFTLSTPVSKAPFGLTGIRSCDDDLCAVGTKDGRPAFYRFSASGAALRQMVLSEEPDLPASVREALGGPGTFRRGAVTRTGLAYVAVQNGKQLRIMRLSLNFEATPGDAGTDAPSFDATSDASTGDARKDDASDAGSD